jgi:hypothetical protein
LPGVPQPWPSFAEALEPDHCAHLLSHATAHYRRRDPRGVIDYRRAFRLDPLEASRELVRVLVEDVGATPRQRSPAATIICGSAPTTRWHTPGEG